ncbi:MAG: hypothetical protein KAF91_07520 [Nostoc sp. TH1S01]|nr:hypothetical protein [Nostoc sp. TH1S01]
MGRQRRGRLCHASRYNGGNLPNALARLEATVVGFPDLKRLPRKGAKNLLLAMSTSLIHPATIKHQFIYPQTLNSSAPLRLCVK